ncbi:hypothetical protein Pcinc_007306 [Petrolisthes cinctipes]|uniref:Uncharacterized protein n=1 Tax=Petrolisthes cinctipes TaxID=88211 RepID=A0AAE1L0K4_PETCI|nr:hypothetical protein Pcinc_007306 [Petrolisthes cinctipes]
MIAASIIRVIDVITSCSVCEFHVSKDDIVTNKTEKSEGQNGPERRDSRNYIFKKLESNDNTSFKSYSFNKATLHVEVPKNLMCLKT